MIDLPAMPARIAGLRRDDRGYPVPWFVAWMDGPKLCVPGAGKPDFRVIAPGKLEQAFVGCRCWLCGGPLGRHKVYVIGPMCVINRVTSEPACHRDCAEFAAAACPFLTRPREKRSGKNLPENRFVATGAIDRNPGAVCLYQTPFVKLRRPGKGVVFELGPPERVDWWARGRQATRAEILESIESGYPLLVREAEQEGVALTELAQMRDAAMQLLPAA